MQENINEYGEETRAAGETAQEQMQPCGAVQLRRVGRCPNIFTFLEDKTQEKQLQRDSYVN